MPSIHTLFLLLLAHLLSRAAKAQTALTASCVHGSQITTFPACDYFLSSFDKCSSVSDRPSRQACFCSQQVLDSIAYCESELRLCYLNHDLDSSVQGDFELWHSLCDGFVTFTPTTPAISEPTAAPGSIGYNGDFCMNVIAPACRSASILFHTCYDTITSPGMSQLTSCICKPEIIRHDYTCQFLGNTSCRGTGATVSNILEYSWCSNFQSVIGTNSTTPPVVKPTLSADFTPPPTSSLSRLPQPTPTSTKSSRGLKCVSSPWWWMLHALVGWLMLT